MSGRSRRCRAAGRLRALKPPHGARFHLQRLSRSRAVARNWRTAARSAIARGVPVGCGRLAAAARQSPRARGAGTGGGARSSAPKARCFSAAASSPTSRCSRRCRSAATSSSRRAHPRQRPRRHAHGRRPSGRGPPQRRAGFRGCHQGLARARAATGQPWIAVESLYSMDGDRAPLDELAAIALRHEGVLIIDEAHATGVLGPDGRGLAAHLEGRDNVITLHTCGKALGAMGGARWRRSMLCDYLVNRARAFIYATAPSPLDGRSRSRRARHLPLRAQRGARSCIVRLSFAASELRPRAADSRRPDRKSSRSSSAPMTRAVALAASMQGARLRHPGHAPADRARRHRASAPVADAQRRRGEEFAAHCRDLAEEQGRLAA